MKTTIIILAIAAAALTACTSGKTLADRRAYVSWTTFCATRGYNINDNTHAVANEYLDTWCGSTEEEAAFIAAGAKPY